MGIASIASQPFTTARRAWVVVVTRLGVVKNGRHLVVTAADSLDPRVGLVELNGRPVEHDVLMTGPERAEV